LLIVIVSTVCHCLLFYTTYKTGISIQTWHIIAYAGLCFSHFQCEDTIEYEAGSFTSGHRMMMIMMASWGNELLNMGSIPWRAGVSHIHEVLPSSKQGKQRHAEKFTIY